MNNRIIPRGGLLSDRQIRKLCQTPSLKAIADSLNNDRDWRSHLYYQVGEPNSERAKMALAEAERRLAEWPAPMIEPFEPGQVRYRQITLESITEERLREVNKLSPDDYPNLPDHIAFDLIEEQRETARSTAKLVYERMVEEGMPEPEKIISYGTSSYGYDVRCGRQFKVFTNIHSTIVDPKNFDEKSFVDVEGDYCIIPPNSFVLARTMEYFRIPRDTLVVCLGKSTYARCGIVVGITPLEPEWEGEVTLEFSNTTNLPAKIYAGEGVAQMLFFQGNEQCETSYKDRDGKYMQQTGVVLPRT